MDQPPIIPERKVTSPESRDKYQDFQDSIRNLRCKVQDLLVARKENSITEKQYTFLVTQLAKRLEDKEDVDSLTNVFNNRAFLESELSRLRGELESKEGAVMVIFLDLKKFKDLNDEVGHVTGDKALVAVADRIKKITKRVDIIFRFGGDEFLLLMPINDTNPRTCRAIFNRVKKDLHTGLSVVNAEGRIIEFKVSMGHAVAVKGDKMTNEELITKADKEMYTDKSGITKIPHN